MYEIFDGSNFYQVIKIEMVEGLVEKVVTFGRYFPVHILKVGFPVALTFF